MLERNHRDGLFHSLRLSRPLGHGGGCADSSDQSQKLGAIMWRRRHVNIFRGALLSFLITCRGHILELEVN